MMATEQMPNADAGRLDRGVRAPNPERAAFEAWCMKRWAGDRGALYIRDMPGSERLGEYVNGHVQFAWDAWQAARPKSDKVGAIVGVAAALAQRKPLRALDPLTEVTHIGHRQMARAYAQADEDTRLLACKLADAVRAL
jgi:hypothetical protein